MAQELTGSSEEYIEDTQEKASEEGEGEMDVSALTNDLTYYSQHPINLNSASREDLYKLQILTDYQIEALIDYRHKNNFLRSVSELLYVPGFSEAEVETLYPFVTCSDAIHKFRIDSDLLKYSENEFLMRWQRVLEKQKGYQTISDSVLNSNPDQSRYLGKPGKIYMRYQFSSANTIKGGFLAEKDPGEEFFKGSNKYGFDFYSGYLFYNNKPSHLRSFVIGDYHIQSGQGLLLWSSFTVGKSGFTNSICKRSIIIDGNTSAEENRFLRGAALTVGLKNYSITAFGSKNKIDATIADSIKSGPYFTGFLETGNHNTPLYVSTENSLRTSAIGTILRYDGKKLKAGLTALQICFDKYYYPGNELYKAYSFTGKKLTGYSADYRLLNGIWQLFGETAISNNAIASLNGLLYLFKPGLEIGAIYHYYQPAYYAYFSNAFKENSGVTNENGFLLSGAFRFSDTHINIYGDVFSFPWLKYIVSVPSEGYEFYLETERKINKATINFQCKIQEKPLNYSISNNLEEIKAFQHNTYRINSSYPTGSLINMQSRIEMSKAGYRGSTKESGFLVFHDINLHNQKESVEFSMRVTYFNIVDYDARIYAYERDLLYESCTKMYYGKG